MTLLDQLRERILESKSRLQEVTDRLSQAIQDRDMYTADLAGYERALNAELRRDGTVPFPTPVTQTDLPLENGDNASTEPVNKAEFTRQFIRGRADVGSTPADILKGFHDAGIPVGKPYIYALVQRIQKQGWIKPRRGRWFPVPESDRPQVANGNGGS